MDDRVASLGGELLPHRHRFAKQVFRFAKPPQRQECQPQVVLRSRQEAPIPARIGVFVHQLLTQQNRLAKRRLGLGVAAHVVHRRSQIVQ